ncbi:uncharacterized protein LOC131721942 isoform X4 [Acipenser ruthenus]|uniref:uncharacterized protein LOC131721942 isoform X4 n=1 Tax=Acipenser ruthenus TaxID=7906 RepID=UPI00274064A6|nr:uncharacterized protein LOC131721942 isoform X4 [Acipenser ruthenus]
MKPDTKACTSTFPARTLQREAEAHRAQDKTADKLQEKLGKWTIDILFIPSTAMDQPQDSQPSAPLSPSVGQEGPAVAIRFEKAQNRIQKFTEGHPGSLGVTQIMVCLFHFGCTVIIFESLFPEDWSDIAAEFLMLIAGALAIASDKTLRLPITIDDCIFMEMLFALAVQVAIGITIASYCCKAIQCCGAPRSVPVIVIQQPSEQTES